MPKIIEYNPSSPKLSPNDRALQAWETAGRRVGPLYNQAAQDIRQAGAVKGEMEKAKAWPFDIYALEASNAPQIHNTTSTETRETKNDGPFVTGYSVSPSRGGGSSYNSGSTQDADILNQYANAGYSTTPESAANASNDWMYSHGEASAGAVGMSRMARAAAQGRGVHEGAAGGGNGASSGHRGVHADDPDYNGSKLYTIDGVTHTPHDWQTIWDRQRVIADRDQARLDRWNRQKAADDKADWTYWNGPNGFNTRRDQWIDGKGGINDQWQQDYNRDLITQEKAVAAAKKADPTVDEGVVRQNIYNKMHVTDPVQSTYGSYSDNNPQYRIQYGTPTVGDYIRSAPAAVMDTYNPSNIIGAVKGALGSMFSSTLEDDEPAATADIEE